MARASVAAGDGHGRIGPNAVIRLAEALEGRVGMPRTRAIFAAAGQIASLDTPPTAMVDETIVTALYAALRNGFNTAEAAATARRAGELTAEYLLAHRIPAAVRGLLVVLPPSLAARVLVGAVRRHAWTFAGSGRFAVTAGQPLRLSITDCPVCRGASAPQGICDYYAATFERLFVALVAKDCRVREVGCEATGDPACTFEIAW